MTSRPTADAHDWSSAGEGGAAPPIFPRHSLSIAVILAGLVLVLHGNVVFRGKSLIHTNYSNPIDFRQLPQNYGPALVPPEAWSGRNLYKYPNLRDPGAVWWQWEPSTTLLEQAIQLHEWPFWNPYTAAGTPAMTNLVPAFFFPPYTLLAALGASPGLKNAYFLVLLWTAGLFTALLCRQHRLGVVPALFAGSAVLTGGAMTQNLGSFVEQTAASLPVTLYVTRVLFDRPGPRRAAVLAAVYAAAALASFPPVLFGVFGVTACYALACALVGDHEGGAPGRRAAAGWWAGATALSLGLVGAYYLPVLAMRPAMPHVAEYYRTAGLQTMPVDNLYQLLSGTAFGGVQIYLAGPFATPGGPPHLPYAGVTCLLLALLARPTHGRRDRALFLAAASSSAIILLKAFGVPPAQWIAYLPPFNEVHFVYYVGIPLGFTLALLAGLGLEALLAGRVWRSHALAATVIVLAAIERLWWRGAATPGFTLPEAVYWVRDWKVLATVGVIAGGAVLISTLNRPSRGVAVAAILLAGCGLAEGAYSMRYPSPAAWDIWAQPVPYIRAVQDHLGSGRLLSFGAPWADGNAAFRIPSLDSMMAFNPPRVYALYMRHAGAPRSIFLQQASRLPPEPLLTRAGITVIAANAAFGEVRDEAARRGYRLAFADGFAAVFARSSAEGRVRFASRYRVVTPAQALEEIATAPPEEVLLESDPGVPSAAVDGSARIEAATLNTLRVGVTASGPGLLYVADSYFEGWTATVNGRPAPILPANSAFRAVVVPAGASMVEFRYRPPGLTAGLLVSGVSMLALIGLLAMPRPSRRR